MEIQQHDGVVVDVAGCRQGFAELLRERERGVAGEEGGAQGCCVAALPPPLYIGPLGGGAPAKTHLGWGGGGQGGCLAPQGKWEAPHPRVPNPRRMGGGPWGGAQPTRAGSLPTSAQWALRDRWPHPMDPRDPSGGPGTIPVTPATFPVAETGLPIYNSSPPDHSGTPRDVRDSEQLSGYCILISL